MSVAEVAAPPVGLPDEARSVRFRVEGENESAERPGGNDRRARGPVVDLLDQTKLPGELTRLPCRDVATLHDAIRRLVVRGAPAIGIAAAYGVLLAEVDPTSPDSIRDSYHRVIGHLATSRPTAVNLFWALDRMRSVVTACDDEHIDSLADRLRAEATAIDLEDQSMCRSIGRHGAGLLAGCERVLTHCNAGSLATSLWGTALSPIYQLQQDGHVLHVFADETRPLMQGARLTAWELAMAGIPVTVCTDSMAGGLMRAGQVDAVIVGADRIAANGDVANKIGTYPLAVLARHHGLPFYVAAPTSTFDPTLTSGDLIPIEMRDESEITQPGGPAGTVTVPQGVAVINPAFDVTPAELVTALITQRGVIERPTAASIAAHLAD